MTQLLKKQSTNAFSLVELSIVILIIGFIVGAVIAGRSLIRNAELRSVISDFQQYSTAAHTFKVKYFAFPGDMMSATDFWNTNTSNGNGDGNIDINWSATVPSEHLMFWNQLALANLIPGSYTGITGIAGFQYLPGENAPESRMSNAVFGIRSNSTIGDGWQLDANYINALVFASIGSGGDVSGTILTPQEAWVIDAKLDDGRPAKGNIISMNWQWGCMVAETGALSSSRTDLHYNLTNDDIGCNIIMKNIF